tara:strand:+ start:665 stop:946 length:282 start_codon:yes stop_codon:yes gene_type:complete
MIYGEFEVPGEVMGQYKTKDIGHYSAGNEGRRMNISVKADSYGYVTVEFGHSMTLRLNKNDACALRELLQEADLQAMLMHNESDKNTKTYTHG